MIKYVNSNEHDCGKMEINGAMKALNSHQSICMILVSQEFDSESFGLYAAPQRSAVFMKDQGGKSTIVEANSASLRKENFEKE